MIPNLLLLFLLLDWCNRCVTSSLRTTFTAAQVVVGCGSWSTLLLFLSLRLHFKIILPFSAQFLPWRKNLLQVVLWMISSVFIACKSTWVLSNFSPLQRLLVISFHFSIVICWLRSSDRHILVVFFHDLSSLHASCLFWRQRKRTSQRLQFTLISPDEILFSFLLSTLLNFVGQKLGRRYSGHLLEQARL